MLVAATLRRHKCVFSTLLGARENATERLLIRLIKLKNSLPWMMGENLITHLGNEYYD